MPKITKLYQLLENSATRFPNQTALVFSDKKVSYRDLNASADHIKELLVNISISSGDRVAICCPKSIGFVFSIFGILKTGAAYLPVDHSSPLERNKFIIKNCEAAALIISKELFENFNSVLNAKNKKPFSFFSFINNNFFIVLYYIRDCMKMWLDSLNYFLSLFFSILLRTYSGKV